MRTRSSSRVTRVASQAAWPSSSDAASAPSVVPSRTTRPNAAPSIDATRGSSSSHTSTSTATGISRNTPAGCIVVPSVADNACSRRRSRGVAADQCAWSERQRTRRTDALVVERAQAPHHPGDDHRRERRPAAAPATAGWAGRRPGSTQRAGWPGCRAGRAAGTTSIASTNPAPTTSTSAATTSGRSMASDRSTAARQRAAPGHAAADDQPQVRSSPRRPAQGRPPPSPRSTLPATITARQSASVDTRGEHVAPHVDLPRGEDDPGRGRAPPARMACSADSAVVPRRARADRRLRGPAGFLARASNDGGDSQRADGSTPAVRRRRPARSATSAPNGSSSHTTRS